MASVSSITNSSSSTSAIGMSGKGIGGLATGLDTDSLVAALTAGTKSKIAKQGQQKQLLNWKMTAYRTMATALSAFQNKNLKNSSSTSSSGITNITRNDFFNTFKATSNSAKVSVSATNAAVTGNYTINSISQLADSESFSGLERLTGSISFDVSKLEKGSAEATKNAFKGQTLKLDADGFTTKTIKLDDLNLDNIINADGTVDASKFRTGLQSLINTAYKSSNVITVGGSGGNITLDSSYAKVSVNTQNDLLGLKVGDSNRVNTNKTIGELFGDKISGDVLSFNINGVEITVNKTDTISSMMSKITNSSADVRMEYDKYNDVFKLTSKKTGADSALTMNDIHGNLLNQIFGAKSGNGITTGYLNTGASETSQFVNKIDGFGDIAGMSEAEKKALVSTLKGTSFEMTINGVTKNVKLDTSLGIDSKKLEAGTYTADDIYNAINLGIQNAFSGSGVTFSQDKATGHTVMTSSKGEAFSVKAGGKFAEVMGFNDGQSSIVVGNAMQDFGYSTTIGSKEDEYVDPASVFGLTESNPTTSFEMTINGVTKTIEVSLDERDPKTDAEKAELEADPTKKFYSEMTGDVFTARLNHAVKAAFGDDAVTFNAEYKYDYQTIKDNDGLDNTVFNFNSSNVLNSTLMNGSDKVGKVIKENSEGVYVLAYTKDGTSIDNYNFDSDGYLIDGEGKRISDDNVIRTLVDKDGNLLNGNGEMIPKSVTGVHLTLNTSDTGKVPSKAVTLGSGFDKLGFEETSNADPTKGITLSELNMGSGSLVLDFGAVDGGNNPITYTVDYNEDMTLNAFLDKLNTDLGGLAVAGIKDGKLYIDSTSDTIKITDSGNMLKNAFGISGGSFETQAASADQKHTAGKNAILEIDGRAMEWSSNNISYNGINITLVEESTEKIQIGVQADPDDVIKRIKDWMDDYNALVFTLNSAINESKNLDYSPLTDEQRGQMTEDQIKTWEAEAKKGVLRNDQTLRQILSDMRGSLYQKVEAAGISLYDIGIVTKSGLSNPNEAGQLEFDKNLSTGGEERLRQMLLNNPDKVRMLFTSEDGIGAKLNNIITRAANTSSVDRGTLVRIAGTEQLTGDNTSQIGNKISAIDKYVAQLKSRLESEYNRYWKRFSALETSVQKMNSQSSWLASQ